MHRLLAALERIMSPTNLNKNIKQNYKFIIKKKDKKKKQNLMDNKNKKNQALAYFTEECYYDDFEMTIDHSINNEKIEINNHDNYLKIPDDNECDCRNDIT